MRHEFFKGIDFQSDLKDLKIKEKLEKKDEPVVFTSPSLVLDLESETGAREFLVTKYGEKKPNEPILTGHLIKISSWKISQEREF